MATYAFETITAAQALAITAGDTLTFGFAISANRVTVLYNASGTLTLEANGRTVEFGAALSPLSQAGRTEFSGGARLFVGEGGDNTLSGETGFATDDGLYGGAGADRLRGERGGDLLQGNTGADTLEGGAGGDVIYGGQDNDFIRIGVSDVLAGDDGRDFAQGNRGDDSILGQGTGDTLLGGQGADTIDGAGFLNGNLGDDVIFGRNGSDTILGEGGNDRIEGEIDIDFIDGGDGDDIITTQRADTVLGGLGNDTVTSHGGAQVRGGDGHDVVRGAGRLLGEEGDDTLQADTDNVGILDGGNGNDLVEGGREFGRAETLFGRAGADTLVGFAGRDLLSGGDGPDLFRYHEAGEATVFAQSVAELEHIAGWAAEDRLQFLTGRLPDGSRVSIAGTDANYAERTAADFFGANSAAFEAITAGKTFVAVQVGADVILFAKLSGDQGASDAIVLTGRTLADIGFDNIV